MSGHIFFKDRWYGFDDGLYAGAPHAGVIESPERRSVCGLECFAAIGQYTGIAVKVARGWLPLIAKLQREAQFPGSDQIITIDGLRVEYPDGFWLGAFLEHYAGDCDAFRRRSRKQALQHIQAEFKRVITAGQIGCGSCRIDFEVAFVADTRKIQKKIMNMQSVQYRLYRQFIAMNFAMLSRSQIFTSIEAVAEPTPGIIRLMQLPIPFSSSLRQRSSCDPRTGRRHAPDLFHCMVVCITAGVAAAVCAWSQRTRFVSTSRNVWAAIETSSTTLHRRCCGYMLCR